MRISAAFLALIPLLAHAGMMGPNRDASGTSWQPDSTPHEGWHLMTDDWMLMAHGVLDFVHDDQGGKRGGEKDFAGGMLMLMAEHDDLLLRAMVSPEPLMGAGGYPLLFATGETANGRDPLIDRQHPHNLVMELSVTYALGNYYLYAGMPGEPALGPPAFMHRLSGMDNPEAPITHHWLDSTHITNGVVTTGRVFGDWKIEASAFSGREPNQQRYQINDPNIDSYAARLSVNPTTNWALQVSYGYLKSPEQLSPQMSERRATASASYNLPFGGNDWATTFAWGRKNDLDGFLLESALILQGDDRFYVRLERADEEELAATPSKASLGYVHDFPIGEHFAFGIGGTISRYLYDGALNALYGDNPTSGLLYVRVKLI